MSAHNVGGLQLQLLCFIADKYEPDVAALQEEYERWHETDINYQSVYQAAERLNELDLVEKKPLDGRRNCYMLTIRGTKLLNTHRELVLERTSHIEDALN